MSRRAVRSLEIAHIPRTQQGLESFLPAYGFNSPLVTEEHACMYICMHVCIMLLPTPLILWFASSQPLYLASSFPPVRVVRLYNTTASMHRLSWVPPGCIFFRFGGKEPGLGSEFDAPGAPDCHASPMTTASWDESRKERQRDWRPSRRKCTCLIQLPCVPAHFQKRLFHSLRICVPVSTMSVSNLHPRGLIAQSRASPS